MKVPARMPMGVPFPPPPLRYRWGGPPKFSTRKDANETTYYRPAAGER